MNELEPRGQERDAARWDGLDRRARPSQQEVGQAGAPARWRGGRLGEQLLVSVGSTVGASAVIWTLQFLAAHVEVHWR
ncbi:hypothetical protein ACFQ0M_00220 [Kitasatospora aburaviensis]|uniref:Uncharacterized protein n=1 Tax=Kitasatospora aburaviensis TaxID=67265 RepID=A0ABW1F1V8_9ACTN